MRRFLYFTAGAIVGMSFPTAIWVGTKISGAHKESKLKREGEDAIMAFRVDFDCVCREVESGFFNKEEAIDKIQELTGRLKEIETTYRLRPSQTAWFYKKLEELKKTG